MSGRGRMRASLAGVMAAGLVAGGVAALGDSSAAPSPGARSTHVAGGNVPQGGRAVHARRSSSAAAVVRPAVRREGLLTGPSSADPARVALRFVRRHSGALRLGADDLRGLEPSGRYRSGGITYLSWRQTYRGIPAVDGGLRAAVARDGRLLALPSLPVPGLAPPSTEPRLSAAAAIRVAAGEVGAPGPASFEDGTRATLAVFGGSGAARLVWRVLLVGGGGWDVVVNAVSGAILRSHSLTREATGIIHQNYPGAAVGGGDQAVSLDPWLSAGNRLTGPNTHVYADPQDNYEPGDTVQSADEIPNTAGNWNYTPNRMTVPGQTCPPSRCTWDQGNGLFSWTVNRSQAATQLFWFVNRFHDHLRDAAGIGFGPSSGSLEGNDPVLAQVDDGSTTGGSFPDCPHANNAGMTVYPNGFPAKLETYLWTSACGETGVYDVNGADDPYVVFHEYTHGLSLRLVTDGAGVGALNDPQPGAMGEAWSDWYAEDYLVAAGLQGDTAAPGELRAGPYLGAARLRTQPFDCPVAPAAGPCPGTTGAGPGGYTYADFGRIVDEPEVHADGEIWAEALWDLRRALVAKHPFDGVTRARALITDGMRLSPPEPSFLDGRDAILKSDAARGYGDRDLIWAVFAARGMGLNATTTGGADTTPVANFTVPPPLPPAPPVPAPGGNVGPPRDTVAPRVTRFGVTSRSFRVGSSSTPRSAARPVAMGTRFRFRLSERANVTIVLSRARAGRRVRGTCRRPARALRRHARCTRWVAAGRLARSGQPAGAAWVRFSGRLGRRPLAPGGYRAVVTARDTAGNRSRAVAARFTVLSPRRSSGA